MGGKSGSSNPQGTTTSVQDTSPWGPQQPYLTDIFSSASNLYHGNTPQYYPNATYAPESHDQREAIKSLDKATWLDHLPGMARDYNAAIATGAYEYYNPAYKPFGSLAGSSGPEGEALQSYLSGERMGAGNPYTDALTSNVLSRVVPGIQSKFISGGSLNSPEAARATSSGAMSALAPLLFQQQQQEEQNQIAAADQSARTRLAAGAGLQTAFSGGMNDMLRGIALAPATDAAYYGPIERRIQAGAAQQQFDQQAINDAVQRWNFGQELPYQQLNNFIGAVTGNYGGTSTLTQPYFSAPQPSLLSQAGQGVGLLSGIGGLFGMFSDRRLKDDIRKVGKLDNGLRVYSYRYKDDPDEIRRIGLMADEVEEIHPEAVATVPFGSLAGMQMVDYARATA